MRLFKVDCRYCAKPISVLMSFFLYFLKNINFNRGFHSKCVYKFAYIKLTHIWWLDYVEISSPDSIIRFTRNLLTKHRETPTTECRRRANKSLTFHFNHLAPLRASVKSRKYALPLHFCHMLLFACKSLKNVNQRHSTYKQFESLTSAPNSRGQNKNILANPKSEKRKIDVCCWKTSFV